MNEQKRFLLSSTLRTLCPRFILFCASFVFSLSWVHGFGCQSILRLQVVLFTGLFDPTSQHMQDISSVVNQCV